VTAADEQKDQREGDRGHHRHRRMVQKAKLPVPDQIGDAACVGVIPVGAENPAHVRIPEPAARRGMDVVLGVGVLVVPAVVARPPDHAALRGGLGGERQHELEPA
jgi:hypothetical protein